MPENNENTIGGKICQKFLLEPPEERILISLHADPTTGEVPQHPPDSPGSRGLVYELCASDVDTLRGFSGASKKPIYPPMYELDTIEEQKLAFVDVVLDPRNYILKFLDGNKKECWVQVRPCFCCRCLIYPGLTSWQIQSLTHTSVQIYTRNQWDEAIAKIDKEVSLFILYIGVFNLICNQRRGFKVAIAFKFSKYVMAFLSQDMLFRVSQILFKSRQTHSLLLQAVWERSREDLPVQYADVYTDLEGFLSQVTDWMLKRRGGRGILKPKERLRNALQVIIESSEFHGAGGYTVPEIFSWAGVFLI
jgi:hypothetical protein